MMISFFNKSNKKKHKREIELMQRSVAPTLSLVALSIDTILLPDIVGHFARTPSLSLLPENVIQRYIPIHLNMNPLPTALLPALNQMTHTNNRLDITICKNFFSRKSELHEIINEPLLAILFSIKSGTKKLPIHSVIEIALYLIPELTNFKVKQVCTEILSNNGMEPPPHPNYILR